MVGLYTCRRHGNKHCLVMGMAGCAVPTYHPTLRPAAALLAQGSGGPCSEPLCSSCVQRPDHLCSLPSRSAATAARRGALPADMEAVEVLQPSTPRRPPSAFALPSGSGDLPWDGARHSPPSPSSGACPSLSAESSLGLDGQRRRKSINVSRHPATLEQCKPPAGSALWRASTAVTESAASQGLSFEALCGGSYIPPDSLHRPKLLGEGAFAGEHARRVRGRRQELLQDRLPFAAVLQNPAGATETTNSPMAVQQDKNSSSLTSTPLPQLWTQRS